LALVIVIVSYFFLLYRFTTFSDVPLRSQERLHCMSLAISALTNIVTSWKAS